jgi:hypothetical protein
MDNNQKQIFNASVVKKMEEAGVQVQSLIQQAISVSEKTTRKDTATEVARTLRAMATAQYTALPTHHKKAKENKAVIAFTEMLIRKLFNRYGVREIATSRKPDHGRIIKRKA